MTTFHVILDDEPDYPSIIEADSAEEALAEAIAELREAAEAWTEYHTVTVRRAPEIEDCEVEIPPRVPDCEDGHRHAWRRPHEVVGGDPDDPGVWGRGGGVITTEVCRYCRWYREVDTWAETPVGPRRVVSYRGPDHEALSWTPEEE